jgi:hypothetical protein
MPIDASIYSAFAPRQKGALDYAQEFAGLDAARQAQAAGALQQQFGQAKFDEYQRGVQKATALEQLMGSMAGKSDAEVLAGLRGAGRFNEAGAMEASILDRQQKAGTIRKDAATAGKTDQETREAKKRQAILDIAVLPDFDGARASIAAKVGSGELPEHLAQGILQSMPQEPAEFPRWKNDLILKMATPESQLQAQTTRRGQDTTAATAAAGQQVTRETAAQADARIRAEGAANRAVQMRGQNMTDARTRDRLVTDKEAAAERRAAEKSEAGVNKYAATLQKEGLPELDAAISAAETELAKYKPGKAPGVGLGTGALPEVLLSSEGKKLRQAVASVRNIVLSARSGAAVTDQELRRMVEELGSSGMNTEEALRNGLQAVRDRLEAIKANAAAGVPDEVKDAYESRGGLKIQRGGKKPDTSGASGMPSTDAIAAELARRAREGK